MSAPDYAEALIGWRVWCVVDTRAGLRLASVIHEHAPLGPPESDLFPFPGIDDTDEHERCDRPSGYDMQRNAEALGDRARIAIVPVQQLENSGRHARSADPLLHTLAVDRIDHPDLAVRHQRVRAALEHLVLGDPAEAAVELVAEPDLQGRFHIVAYVSSGTRRA